MALPNLLLLVYVSITGYQTVNSSVKRFYNFTITFNVSHDY